MSNYGVYLKYIQLMSVCIECPAGTLSLKCLKKEISKELMTKKSSNFYNDGIMIKSLF